MLLITLIVSLNMYYNEAMHNANTCLGFGLAFYRYTIYLNMYSSIIMHYNVIHTLKHSFLLDQLILALMNSH